MDWHRKCAPDVLAILGSVTNSSICWTRVGFGIQARLTNIETLEAPYWIGLGLGLLWGRRGEFRVQSQPNAAKEKTKAEPDHAPVVNDSDGLTRLMPLQFGLASPVKHPPVYRIHAKHPANSNSFLGMVGLCLLGSDSALLDLDQPIHVPGC